MINNNTWKSILSVKRKRMFKYFDFEVLKASILMIIILLLLELSRSQKKNRRRNILIYLFLALTGNFFSTYYHASTAQSNRDAFNDNHTLQCHEALSDYRVSKFDGWETTQKWFVKESLMIRSDKCSRF